MPSLDIEKIAVIGLGYVGLPLAVEFGKQLETVGFDIDHGRIEELRRGHDRTMELTNAEIASASKLKLSSNTVDIADCSIYVVTVPTPINEHKQPDFGPLLSASRMIGSVLKRGDIVIYESTVFPGATEDICVPELERASGLVFNTDFAAGYSPERINPGDKVRSLTSIPKVTSGSTPAAAATVDALYKRIISAGTHLAPSIKVAEAAKVIENTQRDANIALINEFALIFNRLGIDTNDVLAAASTKWNFLPYKPGLVGGHCIGVDPYYLIQKAQSVGYFPDILLACRRINDAMGAHVASELVKLLVKAGRPIAGSKVLILGFTFKEDCPDLRNTRVIDLISELLGFNMNVDVYDPWANREEAKAEYGIDLTTDLSGRHYDSVVLAVAHSQFVSMDQDQIRSLCNPGALVYDIKGVLPRSIVDGRL